VSGSGEGLERAGRLDWTGWMGWPERGGLSSKQVRIDTCCVGSRLSFILSANKMKQTKCGKKSKSSDLKKIFSLNSEKYSKPLNEEKSNVTEFSEAQMKNEDKIRNMIKKSYQVVEMKTKPNHTPRMNKIGCEGRVQIAIGKKIKNM
jgi:hypothetical protein